MSDTTSAPALAPCPWCSRTPGVTTRDVEPQGDPWYGKTMATFVLCDCGACLFDGSFHEGFSDEASAIATWNRRATQAQAAQPDHTALLRECLEHLTALNMLVTHDDPAQMESLMARLRSALDSSTTGGRDGN